ncbi:MAG: hypothetical protein HQL72_14900 [Magnetococcales bacterium]|nr:hypothetical protein [Magnetococcales bacterium]
MANPAFSGSFDLTALNTRIATAENQFDTAWQALKSNLTNIMTVNLSGTESLPCLPAWDIPYGGSVQLCLSDYSIALSYLASAILVVATVTALSVVFRG